MGCSARRLATARGYADVEAPADAGIGPIDAVAAVAAAAVAGRDERVDPRIPSSSMTWDLSN